MVVVVTRPFVVAVLGTPVVGPRVKVAAACVPCVPVALTWYSPLGLPAVATYVAFSVPSAATVWPWPSRTRLSGKRMWNVTVSPPTAPAIVNVNVVPTFPAVGSTDSVAAGFVVVGGTVVVVVARVALVLEPPPPPHAAKSTTAPVINQRLTPFSSVRHRKAGATGRAGLFRATWTGHASPNRSPGTPSPRRDEHFRGFAAASCGNAAFRGNAVPASRQGSRLVAIVAVAAVLAAACGGGGGKGTTTKGQGSGGTPVEGGRLVYGLDAETQGGYCDTTAQLAASGIIVNGAIYDTLVVPAENGGYAPYLAQSVAHSADYLTWTVRLRASIQFQDGEPFDANAVKANFDAYRKGALFSFVFSNVVDEQVVDPMTIAIHMKKPWIAFEGYLWGTGRLGMIAPNHLNASDCALHPVGTGPFMVREYVPNDHMAVVKNPHYWRKDNGGRQLPYLDEIEFRPIIDPYQRLNALRTGQIQAMLTDNGDVIYQIRQAVNQGALASVENQHGAEVAYTMLRVDKPPFDDPIARQAVAYAGDKNEVNDIIYHGVNTPTNTPFAPDVFGYIKDPITPPISHDLNRAKQLVDQYKAAHGGQFKLTISATNDPTVIKAAQLVQSQWQRAGVDVSIKTADQATLINQALGGQFQAVTWRNHPGGDPDGQYVWWHSGSPVNFNNIKDAQIDKDLDDGRSNTDVNARRADYEDLQRVFARQLYNLWGFYALWTFATTPNVHGITGPALPDGSRQALVASVHPVVGIWLSK